MDSEINEEEMVTAKAFKEAEEERTAMDSESDQEMITAKASNGAEEERSAMDLGGIDRLKKSHRLEDLPRTNKRSKPSKEDEEEPSAMDVGENEQEMVPAKSCEKAEGEAPTVESKQLRHFSVVFIGHTEAGKSSVGLQILRLTGRESLYLSHMVKPPQEVMDDTIGVAQFCFTTENARFAVWDAPARYTYLSENITGALLADLAVLVISAVNGEFELGLGQVGQTAIELVQRLGGSKLVVVVNKMDDPTVNWSEERYSEIEQKTVQFLKLIGYDTEKDVVFLPISSLYGINMDRRMDQNVCTWWAGRPCFFEALDSIEILPRNADGPFRMPIIDHIQTSFIVGRDRSYRLPCLEGKVEDGSVRVGDYLVIMPIKAPVRVSAINWDVDDAKYAVERAEAGPLESLMIWLEVDDLVSREQNIPSGFTLSSKVNPVPAVTEFVALLEINSSFSGFITAGYTAMMYIHAAVEECMITEIIRRLPFEKPTRRFSSSFQKVKFGRKGDNVLCRIQVTNLICVEMFDVLPRFGRFVLLSSTGEMVAFGAVTELTSAKL